MFDPVICPVAIILPLALIKPEAVILPVKSKLSLKSIEVPPCADWNWFAEIIPEALMSPEAVMLLNIPLSPTISPLAVISLPIIKPLALISPEAVILLLKSKSSHIKVPEALIFPEAVMFKAAPKKSSILSFLVSVFCTTGIRIPVPDVRSEEPGNISVKVTWFKSVIFFWLIEWDLLLYKYKKNP